MRARHHGFRLKHLEIKAIATRDLLKAMHVDAACAVLPEELMPDIAMVSNRTWSSGALAPSSQQVPQRNIITRNTGDGQI